MIFQTQRKFNSVFQIQDQIEKESINVFTPKTIKGLEFDVVIVIEKGMNTNDKYVSYTRALTHLVIIND